MTDLIMASSRDASAYNMPNVRSPKAVHVAVIDGRYRDCWTSACSGAVLDETAGMPARTVPVWLRCRRQRCAALWPES